MSGKDYTDTFDSEELASLFDNRRRRLAYQFLRQSEKTDITTLSKLIASIETGKDVDELEEEEIRIIYNALRQFHLPRLDEADLIEYNTETGDIKLVTEEDLPTISVRVHSDDGRSTLRAVMFASTFVTSIVAFAATGLIGQITTYILPILIIVLLYTLMTSDDSSKQVEPPNLSIPDLDSEPTSS